MNTYRLLCLVLTIATLTDGPGKASAQTDKAKDDANSFPTGDPAQLGVDVDALMRLKAKAESEQSDAVVIIKDGKLIADWDFGKERGLIQARSATKSVLNLAVGRLIDQGKLTLDQPVFDFFPEWKQGRKQLITVRHLLNHTSGLEDSTTSIEIEVSPDFVQFALASDLAADPGSRFFYSNKATNLLAAVVRRAAGKPLDEYVKQEIFTPLGIKEFEWLKDPAGNTTGMAGLGIRAIDLAKIGQLMLDEGAWRGKQVVSREWVAKSISEGQAHNPRCGLLWWRTPETIKVTLDDDFIRSLNTQLGFTDATVKKLEALKGKLYDPPEIWPSLFQVLRTDDNLKSKLREVETKLRSGSPNPKEIAQGPTVAFSAVGYLGQYVVVIPRHRIVAVRQRRKPQNDDPKDYRNEFGQFEVMVRALVK